MLGRVYSAAVVLPNNDTTFRYDLMKDSKKFTSKKKLQNTADYIKQNALAWHIEFIDADIIDKINILKAVMQGMHNCIKNTVIKLNIHEDDCTAIIDGNYFTPYMVYNNEKQALVPLKSITVEKGDAKFMGIAAASILAKTARDEYVDEMCDKVPLLDEYYGFRKNVGYATKQHREGIQKHGITKWHRKTYGETCRNATVFDIENIDN